MIILLHLLEAIECFFLVRHQLRELLDLLLEFIVLIQQLFQLVLELASLSLPLLLLVDKKLCLALPQA